MQICLHAKAMVLQIQLRKFASVVNLFSQPHQHQSYVFARAASRCICLPAMAFSISHVLALAMTWEALVTVHEVPCIAIDNLSEQGKGPAARA